MLQNHKMEEKIEFEEDKIMSIFFKKEKEAKKPKMLTRHEDEYRSTQESDIFNKHGHTKITCPIQLNPEFEAEFLSSINIKE